MAWRREVEALVDTMRAGAPVTVVTFLGRADPSEARRAALAEIRLAPEGRLVVVDHNRPRRPLAALRAVLAPPWLPGVSLRVRWRRLAYPVAREVQAAGFKVERLLLVAGERVQVVVARARS